MLLIKAAPFKVAGAKRTLAGKACQLGLDVYGKRILAGERVSLDIKLADDKGMCSSEKEPECVYLWCCYSIICLLNNFLYL